MSTTPIPTPFHAALARRRDALNAAFRAAATRRATLDPEGVKQALVATLEPLVAALAAADVPEARLDAALEAGFDAVLAFELASPEAALGTALQQAFAPLLLTRLPLVAREPRRTVARLANALLNVAGHAQDQGAADPAVPPADLAVDAWGERMLVIARTTATDEQVFAAGGVAAWSLGLAHLRTTSLQRLTSLPLEVGAAALGLKPPREPEWQAWLEALRDDPLFRPGATTEKGPRLERSIGGFAGSGGRFLKPPRVAPASDHVLASDGHKSYRVYVDVFGSSWVPVPLAAVPQAPDNGDLSPKLPGVVAPVTAAAVGSLVAVTVRDSLKIRLVARG